MRSSIIAESVFVLEVRTLIQALVNAGADAAWCDAGACRILITFLSTLLLKALRLTIGRASDVPCSWLCSVRSPERAANAA